jgi:hypothetical protein
VRNSPLVIFYNVRSSFRYNIAGTLLLDRKYFGGKKKKRKKTGELFFTHLYGTLHFRHRTTRRVQVEYFIKEPLGFMVMADTVA